MGKRVKRFLEPFGYGFLVVGGLALTVWVVWSLGGQEAAMRSFGVGLTLLGVWFVGMLIVCARQVWRHEVEEEDDDR